MILDSEKQFGVLCRLTGDLVPRYAFELCNSFRHARQKCRFVAAFVMSGQQIFCNVFRQHLRRICFDHQTVKRNISYHVFQMFESPDIADRSREPEINPLVQKIVCAESAGCQPICAKLSRKLFVCNADFLAFSILKYNRTR